MKFTLNYVNLGFSVVVKYTLLYYGQNSDVRRNLIRAKSLTNDPNFEWCIFLRREKRLFFFSEHSSRIFDVEVSVFEEISEIEQKSS